MSRVVSRRRMNVLAMAFAAAGLLSVVPDSVRAQKGPLSFESSVPEDQARELAQWFKTEKLLGLFRGR